VLLLVDLEEGGTMAVGESELEMVEGKRWEAEEDDWKWSVEDSEQSMFFLESLLE
jgi:hypothetical protein